MKVLHVLPDTAVDPKQRFLGSTKDFRGRTEYFRDRGIDFEELVVPRRKDAALLRLLRGMDLSGFDVVFLELPIYPRSMGFLRRRHPRLRLLVRPINAELFQHLHYLWSGLLHGYYKRSVRYALFTPVRLYQDWICARRADRLLSITAWESRKYWDTVAGKAKTLTVPYFVPVSYLEGDGNAIPKEDICICLLSTIMNSFLSDAARNFHQAVESLGQDQPEWSFYVTGGNPPRPRRPLPRLTGTGLLDSPFALLAKSKAMAILSDYGFGFKTKILDAILLRCRILITPGLHARLAPELRPFCLVVDPASKESIRAALQVCREPFPENNVNALLRSQAFSALDQAFGRGAERNVSGPGH
jgi:hypothetical protein